MTKLDKLIIEATLKAEALGHQLDAFQRLGSRKAHSQCSVCNLSVDVAVKPHRHDSDIFGELLDQTCEPVPMAVAPTKSKRQASKPRKSDRSTRKNTTDRKIPFLKDIAGLTDCPDSPNFPGLHEIELEEIFAPLMNAFDPQLVVGVDVRVMEKGALPKKILTYLVREMGCLDGVTVRDTNADFVINVVCLPITPAGFSLAYFVAASSSRFRVMLSELIEDESMDLLGELIDDMSSVLEHKLIVGPLEDLEKTCTRIVANFEKDYLHEVRMACNIFKMMQETAEKIFHKKPRR